MRKNMSKIFPFLLVFIIILVVLLVFFVIQNINDGNADTIFSDKNQDLNAVNESVNVEIKQKESFGTFYDVFDGEEPHKIGSFEVGAKKDTKYKIAVQVIPVGSVIIVDEKGTEINTETELFIDGNQKKRFYPVFDNISQTIPYAVQIELYDENGYLVDVIQFERGD